MLLERSRGEFFSRGRARTNRRISAERPRTLKLAWEVSTSAVDYTGAVYGYQGLYCIDGSILPTSLGLNPSLTISAGGRWNPPARR